MPKKRWGTGTRTIRSTRVFDHKKKKVFYVDLKENQDGRFVKVTEACHGKRDTIVIDAKNAPRVGREIIAIAENEKGGEVDGHLQSYRGSSKGSPSRRRDSQR